MPDDGRTNIPLYQSVLEQEGGDGDVDGRLMQAPRSCRVKLFVAILVGLGMAALWAASVVPPQSKSPEAHDKKTISFVNLDEVKQCTKGVPGREVPGSGCDSFSSREIMCRTKCFHDCTSICAQCFPSSATVSVLLESFEPHGPPQAVVTRSMNQLRIGDKVLGVRGFSEVFAFMDHSDNFTVEYLHLKTTSTAALSVTAEHIIYAHTNRIPVPAGSLVEGDTIWLAERKVSGAPALVPTQLVAVTRTKERGLHAPLTAEGTLVVNGVLASSYAGVETVRWGTQPLLTGHQAAKLVHTPLLWLCSLVPEVCGPTWHSDQLGRHVWTQWILDHLGWLRDLNAEHADLQAAILGVEASMTSCAVALVQVLAVGVFSLLEVASALSLVQVITIVVLLVAQWWMKRRFSMKYRQCWKSAL